MKQVMKQVIGERDKEKVNYQEKRSEREKKRMRKGTFKESKINLYTYLRRKEIGKMR